MTIDKNGLIAAARSAMAGAYAPYSQYHVGAALGFSDGTVVTGSNVENASYGLSLCAETVAAAKAFNGGTRGGLIAIAVTGGSNGKVSLPISPCGRCRQVLSELAQLGGTDPWVWCAGESNVGEYRLSDLLPDAFGPASLTTR